MKGVSDVLSCFGCLVDHWDGHELGGNDSAG